MSLPLNATKDRLLTRSRLIFWRDLLASQTGETVSAWVPFAEDAIATIDARDTEIAELRKERDDARLALAMARGEGWPEGWDRRRQCWVLEIADGCWTIAEEIIGSISRYRLTGPAEWRTGPDGPERRASHDSTHQNLLLALRAYQAVKS